MKEIVSFVNRNLKRYFRDRGALIFSLLSVFIVAVLYLFFLAKMQIDYVKDALGDVEGIENMINTWIIGGLVCIPAVSVPLIILCFRVEDKVNGIQNDLLVTSAKRFFIMMGYVLSAIIVGFIMTIICLVLGEVFILIKGGSLLPFNSMLKIVSVLLLVIISFTGFEFFAVLLIKSNSGINVANSILNIFLGFLLGLYVPVGMLGDKVANAIKAFPLLQSSSIIRQIIMEDYIDLVFKGAPQSVISDIKNTYGVNIVIGDFTLSTTLKIAILIIFGIIFYIASLAVLNNRKENQL